MRGRFLVALIAVTLAPAAEAATSEVVVGIDRTYVSTSLGREVSFATTVTNRGSTAAATLVAHLNILSLKPGVYVDPEDWSENRTRYLERIPPGGSRTVGWRLKAVSGGSLAAYVTVIARSGAGTPVTGPALRFDVAPQKTLNAGGILPIALAVPASIALLALGVRTRRRRR